MFPSSPKIMTPKEKVLRMRQNFWDSPERLQKNPLGTGKASTSREEKQKKGNFIIRDARKACQTFDWRIQKD
jgi:hypothetical protein